jgi:hypothetical protein
MGTQPSVKADDDSLFGVVFSHRSKQHSLEGPQAKSPVVCIAAQTSKNHRVTL